MSVSIIASSFKASTLESTITQVYTSPEFTSIDMVWSLRAQKDELVSRIGKVMEFSAAVSRRETCKSLEPHHCKYPIHPVL